MKKQTALVAALLTAGLSISSMFSSCSNAQTTTVEPCSATVSDSTARLPIAYINVDSLLLNYQFAKDLNEELIRKTEDARMTLNSQAASLEKEVNEFQRKLQTNAFLSEERAQQEANRLQKKKDALDQQNVTMQQELAQQQAQMNARLGDTIRQVLKEYNDRKKFELIFSNTMYDNILLDFPKYDITDEVLSILNTRYAAQAEKK
jgi:outer membrane protein